MKKRQIVTMVACFLVGMVGFAGAYVTEKVADKQESQKQQQDIAEIPSTEQQQQVASVVRPEPKQEKNQIKIKETVEEEKEQEKEEVYVETVASDSSLHFAPQNGLTWPLEGNILLDYSMDHTIYFPTLEQYQYNPAVVIAGAVNDKVLFAAEGTIESISTNEETGCTIRQNLGDGYTAVYGQIKDPVFDVGDWVEKGQVVGYVNEATKYYAVEGSNLYFAMEKDGKPIDPLEYFE